MKCEECLPLLEEYADGELGARDAARVEAHTEACAACARARRSVDEERALFLAYECDAAPARGFWDDVLSKIEAEAGGRPSSPFAHQSPSLSRPASSIARARARLGAAFGAFAAPRLSPAVVAALLVVAVGATVAVMKYAAPREEALTNESAGAVAPKNADDAATSSAAASPSSNRGGAVASKDETRSVDGRAAVENEVGARDDEKAERRGTTDGGRERVVARLRGEEKSARGVDDKSVRVKRVSGEESGAARRGSSASAQESAPDRLVREAEQKYLAAIRLLSRDVSSRRARLDVDARARFEQTLAAVDRTIADTRRAAREHPRDPVAVQYMLTAYAKKVELLREMAR